MIPTYVYLPMTGRYINLATIVIVAPDVDGGYELLDTSGVELLIRVSLPSDVAALKAALRQRCLNAQDCP